MNASRRRVVCAFSWLLALPAVAGAQAPAVPLDRPGERPLPVPEAEPRAAPELVLPPLAPVPEQPDKTGLRARVQGFRFAGNSVFSDAELAGVARAYIGRDIDAEDLEAIRLALTRYYVDRGYINSGAIVPDQDVVDGVILLQLVEGRLSDLEIDGHRRLPRAYLADRIALGAGPPLNVYAIRDRLFLLQQDPRIRRLDAALTPGLRPGEARLRIDVEEEPSRRLYLGLNNHRPPSVGAAAAELEFTDYNFFGRGDTLGLRYGLTHGLDNAAVDYALPLNARDTALTLRYARSDADVVEAPFDALDVQSRSETLGLGLWHPYRKTPRAEHGIGLTLERRRSQTFLLGEPFAFEPGADADGRSRVSALRLQLSWLTHAPARVLAARVTYSAGIDAFDASVGAVEPDGRFGAWLGQFQWVERFLARREELVVRADFQRASDPLLSLEQFSLGGANSVRGYRENQIVRDSGWLTSFEYRWPLFDRPDSAHRVQLAAFFDAGRASNVDRPTPEPRALSSAGVGLRGTYAKTLEYRFYYGGRLHNIDNPRSDWQDNGLHLELRARLW